MNRRTFFKSLAVASVGLALLKPIEALSPATVVEFKKCVMLNGQYYGTLAEAFKVVKSGDTIYLRGNVKESLYLPSGTQLRNITFEGREPRARFRV